MLALLEDAKTIADAQHYPDGHNIGGVNDGPASGHSISAEISAKAIDMLKAAGSSFTASMLRDLLDGRRTEHDHILEAVIRRGQSLACQTPLLEVAHTNMAIQA